MKLILILLALIPELSMAKNSTLLFLPSHLGKSVGTEIMEQKNLMDNDSSSSLSGIQLKTYAKAGFNLVFFEVEVKPSVELKWVRQ